MGLALILLATVFPVIIIGGFTVLVLDERRYNRSMAQMVEARRASR